MEKGDNLYTTGYSYRFRTSDLKEEIDIILSKEYCLTLSQAYEVFETYLIELYTELLLFFPEHLVTLKVLSTKLHLPKTSLKEYIKEKIGREKNNRKFINSSRKLSKHFTQHETKNIYNINISTWFDLVSELRHNIVHNRQVVSDKLLLFLKDYERAKLFSKYFARKNTYDGVIIFLTKDNFHKNNALLNEFAYFIFKSLSIDNNLDPTYKKAK